MKKKNKKNSRSKIDNINEFSDQIVVIIIY